jgi:hypothetical protein
MRTNNLLFLDLRRAEHQITVETYVHLVPGGYRQAVDRLDDPQESLPDAIIRNSDTTSGLNIVLRKCVK